MKALVVLLAILAAPATAFGQVVSAAPDKVGIVVYPGDGDDGLVMVTERRTIDLPAGRSRISFRDVAEGIVPQTVAVQGLPDGVIEQNFDYQLLSPGSLIAQSQGRNVSLVRTDRSTGKVTEERARVVSSANGAVLNIAGRIEALKCSALPERLVFDDLPPGFSDKPTLSVEAVSPRAERVTLTLSYLATGISWRANYVARIRPDGRSLALSSWITITNDSSAHFAQASVQVLAGRLERTPYETRGVEPEVIDFDSNCWRINTGRIVRGPSVEELARSFSELGNVNSRAIAGVADFEATVYSILGVATREDLGDYKLYTLPEPTTVSAYQTKQVQMFQRNEVGFDWRYRVILSSIDEEVGHSTTPEPAMMVLELQNDEGKGLGLPLPRGDVILLESAGQGRDLLIGEDSIPDTPQGLPFEFFLGEGPLVQAQTRIVSRGAIRDRTLTVVEVTLTNASSSPVAVQVRENGSGQINRVRAQSQRHQLKYGRPEWLVRVGANRTKVITYTLEHTD